MENKMKYNYDQYIAMSIPELIDKLKEGYILAVPNGVSHFKHLFSQVEQRQNEHDNIKYLYASMIFQDNKEKSIEALKELIEREHEPSMHIYAMLLLRGENIEADREKGLALLEKSSDLGYAISTYALSLIYFNGDFNFEKSLHKAFNYAEKSASQGNNLGYFQMGRICMNRENTKESLKEAITYFEKADIAKYHKKHKDVIVLAYRRLANAYLNGELGLEKNEALAKKYNDKADGIFKSMCD